MAGIRALQRRTKRLEEARKPRPSPVVVLCGSFDEFADATYAEVEAGQLDSQFLHILDVMREWEGRGIWAMAYAR